MKYSLTEIQNRVNKLLLSDFISDKIYDKFTESVINDNSEEQIHNILASISLFLDNKYPTNASYFLGAKDNYEYHKQLITESIFSDYEYLNNNYPDLYPNFKVFEDKLDNEFEFFQFRDKLNNSRYTFGYFVEGVISLKRSLTYLDSNYTDIFRNIENHEFTHFLGMGKNQNILQSDSEGLLLALGHGNILSKVTTISKFTNLNEIETEYISNKMHNENFCDNMSQKKFKILIAENSKSTKFKEAEIITTNFNYKEGSLFSDELNILFPELERTYLDKTKNMSIFLDSLSIYTRKAFLDFNDALNKRSSLIKENNDGLQIHYLDSIKNLSDKFLELIKTINKENLLTTNQKDALSKAFIRNDLIIENKSLKLDILNDLNKDRITLDNLFSSKLINNEITVESFKSTDKFQRLKLENKDSIEI